MTPTTSVVDAAAGTHARPATSTDAMWRARRSAMCAHAGAEGVAPSVPSSATTRAAERMRRASDARRSRRARGSRHRRVGQVDREARARRRAAARSSFRCARRCCTLERRVELVARDVEVGEVGELLFHLVRSWSTKRVETASASRHVRQEIALLVLELLDLLRSRSRIASSLASCARSAGVLGLELGDAPRRRSFSLQRALR